jgi:hypothetical protein
LPGAAIPTTFYPFDGMFWRQAPGGQLEVVGQELPFFSPFGAARVAGDRYFLFGNTAAAEYQGRTFLYGLPTLLVLSGSGSLLTLERALSIVTATDGLGYGAIEDFALVEGGTKAILAVHLDGGFSVAGTAYEIGTGYQGLALVKVKLYDP